MREVFYGVISQGVAPYFFAMKKKICSFFGHRNVTVTEELYTATKSAVLAALSFGCRVFYFGGYGDFDALCYRIVREIKNGGEWDLRLVYCVAQERYLRKLPTCIRREDYDEIIYLTPIFDGWYKSIYFRNCAMIDESAYVVFYAEAREGSGAYKAYRYAAQKKGKHLCNLVSTATEKSPLL